MAANPETEDAFASGNDMKSLAQYVGAESDINQPKVNPAKAPSIETVEDKNAPTKDEVQSLNEYQGPLYRSINGKLRGESGWPDWTDEHVSNIDSLMNKQSPLGKGTVVYKGVSDQHPILATKAVDNPDDLIGAEIQDKGYISTSKDPKVAEGFSSPNGALIRINIPKGVKAVDIPSMIDKGESSNSVYGSLIGAPRKSGFMREQELLLPRNSKFKITGYQKDATGRIIWNADLQH